MYFLLAGLLAARVPLGKAPDENAHIYYVQHLATTHSLPVFKPIGATKDPGYEFHQPPFYYAVCALGWNAAGPGAQNYLCRLVSILFGAATVALIWAAARRLFGDALARYAAGFAALWPLHLNVGASAGNDAAAGFFCALILYLMARGSANRGSSEHAPSAKLCAALGAACGLAMLTKSSSLTVCAVGFGWAVHASLKNSENNRAVAVRNGALVVGVAALLCGPWLGRNTMLYGDPLAARIFDEAFRNSSPRPGDFLAAGIDIFTYLRALFTIMFCTAWGAYGGPNTALEVLRPFGAGPLSQALPSMLLLLLCAAASVAAVLGLVRVSPLRAADEPARRVLLWWIAAIAVVFLGWANFNLMHFQAQARYVHPALLPLAIFAACGWRTLVGSHRAGAVATAAFALLLLAMTWLNAFGWRTLV